MPNELQLQMLPYVAGAVWGKLTSAESPEAAQAAVDGFVQSKVVTTR